MGALFLPIAAPTLAQLAPAPGQSAVPNGRTDENVIRQAEDPFGATIGCETVGIYSSASVRGFHSPDTFDYIPERQFNAYLAVYL